jgi:hypothetical protein
VSAWTFTLDMPCGNDGRPLEPVTGNGRVHHMQRARIHGAIRGDLAVLARSERNRLGAPRAVAKRTIEPVIIRGPGRQFLDQDNAVSFLKPVIDALVDAGWITGDKLAQVDYRMPRQERGARAQVRFTITEGGQS